MCIFGSKKMSEHGSSFLQWRRAWDEAVLLVAVLETCAAHPHA